MALTDDQRQQLEQDLERLLFAKKPSPYDAGLIAFDLLFRIIMFYGENPETATISGSDKRAGLKRRILRKLAELQAEADIFPDDLLNN
jgi:hypothetical protein